MANSELLNTIGVANYSLCMTENCDVTYFNPDNTFYSADIIVPVWFKSNANPKYVCYCNKVTQEEIEQAVTNDNARTVKDVAEITGAMHNANCLHNNPTGKCCSNVIKQVIEQTREYPEFCVNEHQE